MKRSAGCACCNRQVSQAKRQRGFTLMELLLVLVIVGLLAAVVGPTMYQRIKPAKETAVREQIENFGTALDIFLVDMGRYPTTQEGLKVLRAKPDGSDKWNGPYLKKEIPNDPWGNPYVYRAPGRSGGYEIISLSEDGREGGEGDNADINSWETAKKP
ncbi:MAG: type II secretion system major pseudopilin GspG [Gallionellaceae bacterium]